MNLKFSTRLVYFIEIAKCSFGIKKNEYSHGNYGLKNPFYISNNNFEQHPNIDLTSKNITDNERFHISRQQNMRAF